MIEEQDIDTVVVTSPDFTHAAVIVDLPAGRGRRGRARSR